MSVRVRSVMFVVIAGTTAWAVLLGGSVASAAVASPTVAPATGGGAVAVVPGFTSFDPADVGYEQSEFILSGTASAYESITPSLGDGKDSVAPTTTAPYVTRVVVMRPIKPRKFNGTVIVEWFNVSGGTDAGPDWMLGHTELIREGFAYVGVTAQRVGLEALKGADPQRGDAARYAGLSHPGDEYANDIFSQAGQAIRDDARTILGGLKPKHVVAIGESQSAGRLVGYINAVHPLASVYDGFLVHSRFPGAPIRDDLDVPVLVFQTETDVSFSNLGVRQPDTDLYRLWEAAGTAHYDQYGLALQATDTGDGQGAVAILDAMLHPTSEPSANFSCGAPINTGMAHYVLDAAIFHLNQWVTKGIAPPIAPRLETTGTSPVVFATDANGNALGGVRTPAVDAPVSTLSGKSTGGNSFCFLFGSSVAFTPAQLEALYPDHAAFVSAFTRATKSARKAGFLVTADAKEIIAAARGSDVGK